MPEQGESTCRPARPSTLSYEPRRLSVGSSRWEPPPSPADIKIDWNAESGRGRRLREAYFRAKGCWPPPKRLSCEARAAATSRFWCLVRRGRRGFRRHNGHPLIGF